jgi:CIC family chloride channel protein
MKPEELTRKLGKRLEVTSSWHVYAYSALTGLLVGVAAIGFSYVLDLVIDWVRSQHQQKVVFEQSFQQSFSKVFYQDFWMRPRVWLLLLLPTLGGLLAGIAANFLAKETLGIGMDYLINSFHRRDGHLRRRYPVVRTIATLFTIGTGGSAGREGPISQIGAGLGVIIADVFKAGSRARRTLLLAGASAGLGAVFKAPLGGALTTVEMVYKEDIESEAVIPCFISSVVAFLIYTGYSGTEKLYHVGRVAFLHVEELLFYILLGLLCFAYGYLLIKGYQDTRNLIRRFHVPGWIKPAFGGLLVGVISLFFFEITGIGEDYIQLIFEGNLPGYFGAEAWQVALAFLLIALIKVIATTLTLGTGGSGGVFGPSLFIGGMLGAAVGTLAQYVYPESEIFVSSYIMVGMGAFYAGLASASLAGIIMICEITGNYLLLPPLILATVFTRILSNRKSLLKSKEKNRFTTPAHRADRLQADHA